MNKDVESGKPGMCTYNTIHNTISYKIGV
jgi:hypothetical protein